MLRVFIVSSVPGTPRPQEWTVRYRPLLSPQSLSQLWPQGSDKAPALEKCLTKPTEPRSWIPPRTSPATPAPKGRDGRGCTCLGTALIERSIGLFLVRHGAQALKEVYLLLAQDYHFGWNAQARANTQAAEQWLGDQAPSLGQKHIPVSATDPAKKPL